MLLLLCSWDWRMIKVGNKIPSPSERKKFVRYKEGAELYSMCQSKFEQLAKDAGAIYKVNKLVLVNCDRVDEYLETFRIVE